MWQGHLIREIYSYAILPETSRYGGQSSYCRNTDRTLGLVGHRAGNRRCHGISSFWDSGCIGCRERAILHTSHTGKTLLGFRISILFFCPNYNSLRPVSLYLAKSCREAAAHDALNSFPPQRALVRISPPKIVLLLQKDSSRRSKVKVL